MAEKCACNSIWDSLLSQEPHTKICQSTVSSYTVGTVDIDEADHTDLQRIHCISKNMIQLRRHTLYCVFKKIYNGWDALINLHNKFDYF